MLQTSSNSKEAWVNPLSVATTRIAFPPPAKQMTQIKISAPNVSSRPCDRKETHQQIEWMLLAARTLWNTPNCANWILGSSLG
ncbi:hypothetical protein JTE90_022736 [Oedothorax gibbosus]|uniref:Uncharacterized protein n=1 Tax=Oedothorax gibbosus TaxID=931172 RepID=A0AAV6UQZ9_9ARAC|nr:hypothetical protein JTE90_022736 [Oedothorax gibbosus]